MTIRMLLEVRLKLLPSIAVLYGILRRSRLFGQLSGRNKLKPVAGSWFDHSPKSNSSCVVVGCCEACGQTPTCGQGGGNAQRFPRLVHRDRAYAVRRGSAQPTVHKFTAPARHRVRRPVRSLSLIGRGRPRRVYASRAPDADGADYTNRRTRQDCASVRCRWRLGADRPTRA